MAEKPPTDAPPQADVQWACVLARKLKSIRFGQVTLTVHQGQVVQIDCTERTRLRDLAQITPTDYAI
jgi:hypothetical protein